ncbi:MAG: hypothetical protein ACI8X5_003419 [Planctomycetota bacterium]
MERTVILAALVLGLLFLFLRESVTEPVQALERGVGTEGRGRHEEAVFDRVLAPGSTLLQGRLQEDIELASLAPVLKNGWLTLSLETVAGIPVMGSRLILVRAGGELIAEQVSGRGETVFPDIPPGIYWVRVDPASIEKELLVPRIQQTGFRHKQGDYGTSVEVLEGEGSRLPIVLETAALIYGQARDQYGKPLESAHVRLGSRDPGDLRVHREMVDVLGGFYQCYLYPGSWTVELNLGASDYDPLDPDSHSASVHRLAGIPMPVATVVELYAGSMTEFNLQIGEGDSTLKGEFVDERGVGFAGLRMALYPQSLPASDKEQQPRGGLLDSVAGRTSDSHGRFEIDGLMPGTYKVSIEPEGYFALARPGSNRLGRLIQSIPIEIVPGENTLRLEIPRPNPVLVKGEVVLNKAWAEQSGMENRVPKMTLVLTPKIFRKKDSRSSISISRDLAFSFYLEARETEAYLELVLNNEVKLWPLDLPEAGTGQDTALQGTIQFP